MHRGTTQGRPSLSCPSWHQTMSRPRLEEHLEQRLLEERGHLPIWEWVETTRDNSADLADIEAAIRDATAQMAEDHADVPVILERLGNLKDMRTQARGGQSNSRTWRASTETVRDRWEAAHDDEHRREVLVGQMARLEITRGKTGRYLDTAHVGVTWSEIPEGLPLPDGNRMVKRLDGMPEGEGIVAPPVLRLPDGDLLVTSTT